MFNPEVGLKLIFNKPSEINHNKRYSDTISGFTANKKYIISEVQNIGDHSLMVIIKNNKEVERTFYIFSDLVKSKNLLLFDCFKTIEQIRINKIKAIYTQSSSL